MKFFLFTILLIITYLTTFSQNVNNSVLDYSNTSDYEIAEIKITGIEFIDKSMIMSMSGLKVGDIITLPGDEATKIVKKFWTNGLFADVKFMIQKIEGNKVSVELFLKERPRLSRVDYKGVKKSDITDIKEKLKLRQGTQVTEDLLKSIHTIITKHYVEKGYLNVKVDLTQVVDTTIENRRILEIDITKNKRVKIKEIYFEGNKEVKSSKLRKAMKKTKRRDWNIFNTSKLIASDYKEDKKLLIEYYNKNGYRDAKIVSDSISTYNEKRVNVHIQLYEGKKYYFRDITWVGNTKYPSEVLAASLGIKRGDVFNQEELDKRLQIDEDAVSSLYLDNGYLFFNVTPVELKIDNDSIDYEMRLYEGKQASINEIIIKGNTKTNEHVVRRELRTIPGNLFSKSDIIRSVRELASLGHFEPEKIVPNPIPNPANGTVDIEYNLEERANDQLELSGGWGARTFIGSVGLRFSNFSSGSIFEKDAWRPLPSGDGQTLSINASTSGSYYTRFGIMFVEPWLGGRRPNSLSVSLSYMRIQYNRDYSFNYNNDSYMINRSVSIGLGRRIKWPDDFFMVSNTLSFENYKLKNYTGYFPGIDNGTPKNFSLNTTISRVSTDQNIYPRSGSNFSLSLQFTPPYSLFDNKDYSSLPAEEKYNFIEYHKWVFKGEWYFRLIENLVLMQRFHVGILGMYNNEVGYSPFEKFVLGGGGMPMSYTYLPQDIVALRGYEEESVTPRIDDKGQLVTTREGANAGNIYDKFSIELRYPISLKEQAIIYVLSFVDAGNAWHDVKYFNPFQLKRSAGVGLRAALPFLGMLGFDWGYGFDPIPGLENANKSQFHFIFGQQF